MKVLVTNYSFNAAAKQITFGGYSSISLASLLIITNTTSNIIIYNFADPTAGGTINGNILTLTYNTTPMSNTDKLQIYYDDPNISQAVSSDVSAIQDQLGLLRRIVKLLESNATVDSNNRQRISIDASPNTLVVSGSVGQIGTYTVSGSVVASSSMASQLGNSYPDSTNPYTLTSRPAFITSEFPVSQEWRIMHEARNAYANGIRSKII